MAENERNQRRGLLEVLEFAREIEKGITNIESRKNIVSAINFGIDENVRKQIRSVMMKNNEDYVEFVSGDYFIYDVTEKRPKMLCKIDGCYNKARILESRLIFVYDEKDEEYQLGEFSPEVRNILQTTRKRAAICDNDMMEAQIKGKTLDIYMRIPQVGESAEVLRINGKDANWRNNLIKPVFDTKKRPGNNSGAIADVINLFEKKKK